MAEFLSPTGGPRHNPWLLPDINIAVARLASAIATGETVAIYGDYDVDGVASLVLMTETLQALNGNVIPYIPDRATEGYGLNMEAVAGLARQGVKMLVTVDCGSSDREQVALAQALGMDTIVMDHHQTPDILPDAMALVNPRRPDSSYPYPGLAAVGVCYQVAGALLHHLQVEIAPLDGPMLELVALGTVADVAPLLDENRALVKAGLDYLNQTSRPGLKALIREVGREYRNLTARDIGYTLGPRLNAAGRLQHALTSYRLLLTKDPTEAAQLAAKLEATNQARQQLTSEAVAAAQQEVNASGETPWALVLQGELYQSGLAGLVAGHLMEQFYRPAIVIEQGEIESRGSARSIAEFHITDALTGCQDILTRFGGHARAAGFTVPNHRVEAFRQAIVQAAQEALAHLDLAPTLDIDAELELGRVGMEFLGWQDLMAPFGHQNPEPLYLSRRMEVREKRVVGREQENRPRHLQLRLRSRDGAIWPAIAFGRGSDCDGLPRYVDVVYNLKRNVWNGLESIQLDIQDWRPSEN